MRIADMVPRKAAEDFPVVAKCTKCRGRASARDFSAYRIPARPTTMSSRAQAKTVLSASRRRARAQGLVAQSVAHKSYTLVATPWSSAAVPQPPPPPPSPGLAKGGRPPGGGGGGTPS